MGNALGVPLWGIVPVKGLQASKSRLAGVLTPDERSILTLGLLSRVLRLLNDVPEVERVLVVAPRETLAKVSLEGKCVGLEDVAGTLNGAVALALEECRRQGAAALILPSDLPYLERRDVARVIQLWQRGHKVVVCPSCHRGTNGLLIDRDVKIRPAFGRESYRKHLQQAEAAGARPAIFVTRALSFDLDTPEQWNSLPQQFRHWLLSDAPVSR